MSRYTAGPSPYINGGWEVRRGTLLIAETRGHEGEAESKIIAFALNAIAEGCQIASVPPNWGADWYWYDGPTEGVAP